LQQPKVAIHSGGTATYDLQVTAINGFSGTVTLSCAGAPDGSNCSITPETVQANGSNGFIVTVGAVTLALDQTPKSPLGLPTSPALAAVVLLLGTSILGVVVACVQVPARKAQRVAAFSLFLLLAALSSGSGCGGGGGSGGGKPPTSFTISITGNSGGAKRTVNLSLSVSH
jgi:hypothetical protein